MAVEDIDFILFERIYPTQNDVADVPYNGVNGSEINFSRNLHWRYPKNCILADLDGGGLPDDLAGFEVSDVGILDIDVSRGRAYISGRYIEMLAGADIGPITLDDERDNYIYLQLQVSGIVGTTPPAVIKTVPVVHAAVVTPPVDSVLLALVITDGGDITDLIDLRPSQFNIPTNFLTTTAQTSGSEVFTDYVAVKVPDIGPVSSFGGQILINPQNNSSVTFRWKVEATGPNLVRSATGTGAATSSSAEPAYGAVQLNSDMGRFAGNILYFRLSIERLTGSITIDAGTGLDLFNTTAIPWFGGSARPSAAGSASTWSFKEWNSKG